jgi:hypothetical protein
VTQNKPISKDELNAQKQKQVSPVLPEPEPAPVEREPASIENLLDDFEIVEKGLFVKFCSIVADN